jgi:hypothetical protein
MLQVYKLGAIPSHKLDSSIAEYSLRNCLNIYKWEAIPTF